MFGMEYSLRHQCQCYNSSSVYTVVVSSGNYLGASEANSIVKRDLRYIGNYLS